MIIFGKSDEKMPYWLGLDDSFAILYIALTHFGSGIIAENVKKLIFQNLHKWASHQQGPIWNLKLGPSITVILF